MRITKRHALLTAFLLAVVSVGAAGGVTYERADSLTVCRLLAEARRQPQSECLPLFFARQFLGRPYVAHTLEVNDREQLVVNTRELDCTTLVENVVALTLCVRCGEYGFADFVRTLRTLRYRGGRLDEYPSRLHYFSDWIGDKQLMGLVSEVQSPRPPFTAVQRLDLRFMSTHPDSYRALKEHPEYIPQIRRQEQALTGLTFRYIPKAEVKNTRLLRQTVRDGDIIAITCSVKGLDIAHLGFAVWKPDGLHMLNASSIHHKVVDEPMTLRQYLRKHRSHTGIRIIRIK